MSRWAAWLLMFGAVAVVARFRQAAVDACLMILLLILVVELAFGAALLLVAVLGRIALARSHVPAAGPPPGHFPGR